MRVLASFALALAIVAGHSHAAHAQNLHLARAEAAIDELDYTVAREELTRALHQGMAAPGELARIYLLSGIVSGAFGESRLAREQFQRALALRPHARLPSGYAPKIAEPFTLAREAGVRLVIRCEAGVLEIVEDPFEMVDAISASDMATVAVDEYGNHLSAACPKTPGVVATPQMPPPHRRKTPPAGEDIIGPFPADDDEDGLRRNVFARWQLWAGAAVAAGVVGSYYANDNGAGTQNARNQRYAFGAAGACAAAAVVLALDEHRDKKRARRARAAVAPTRGGGAVWVWLDF